MSETQHLYVGTCGFSYKDWIGPFYPAGTRAADMLGYYSTRFGAVEIDSTYYAIPKPALFDGMNRRTPARFRFAVKAPGSLTHIPAEAQPSADDAAAFRACIDPIVRSRKLGAVLLQFPHSFRPTRESELRMRALRRFWPDVPLVAEFRHRDWQREQALRLLEELDVGWCNVDEPRFASLMRPSSEITSGVGYVRFHGRNAAQWWKAGRDPGARYDYLYSDSELTEWLPRIAEVAERTRETYVFFNNHRLGKAAHNARELGRMLRVEPPPAAPVDEPRLL